MFGVEIGDGDCGWERIMPALRDIGYKGWIAAEVDGLFAEIDLKT